MRTNTVRGFVLFLVLATAPVVAQQPPRQREGDLRVGDAAPDLTLQELRTGHTVRLGDLRGQPVVLVFGSCT